MSKFKKNPEMEKAVKIADILGAKNWTAFVGQNSHGSILPGARMANEQCSIQVVQQDGAASGPHYAAELNIGGRIFYGNGPDPKSAVEKSIDTTETFKARLELAVAFIKEKA